MGSILVEYRKVYGNVLIYPANLNAELLAELAGRKTLSERDLQIAERLGFEINRRNEELVKQAA